MSMMLNFSLVMYMNDSFLKLLSFLNFLLELQIQDVEQILQRCVNLQTLELDLLVPLHILLHILASVH